MLIWMCALHCEAKPVIDFYRLKKSLKHTAFDCYNNEDMACIVSGIGLIKMTAAIAWAAALSQHKNNMCWINLGIAGDKKLAVGTTVVASKVSQENNSATIYCIPLVRREFHLKPIISLTSERSTYDDLALFDMEAYAFLEAASRHTTLELCQSIKVISDNATHPPKREKAWISTIIANNMPAISDYALQLHEQAHQHAKPFR